MAPAHQTAALRRGGHDQAGGQHDFHWRAQVATTGGNPELTLCAYLGQAPRGKARHGPVALAQLMSPSPIIEHR
jgi:hypothetical protein